MANNWFSEKIILLNKNKICLSVNAISNEFLREIVVINVMFLWKCQEAVSRATKAISHGNFHSFAAKLLDISLRVKHMTKDSLLHKQLDRTEMQSNV